MTRYVTHQFAHLDTLGTAERWLLQLGIASSQIEVHREGLPWLSVLATPDQSAKVEMVFKAAELTDPEGWPSFWELARLPHAHAEVSQVAVVAPARPGHTPVTWRPLEDKDRVMEESGMTEIWDVFARYS